VILEATVVFGELDLTAGVLGGVSMVDFWGGNAGDDHSTDSCTSGAGGEAGLCVAGTEAMLISDVYRLF
jgi:hypothetical protein